MGAISNLYSYTQCVEGVASGLPLEHRHFNSLFQQASFLSNNLKNTYLATILGKLETLLLRGLYYRLIAGLKSRKRGCFLKFQSRYWQMEHTLN